jgi:hypothetical protein
MSSRTHAVDTPELAREVTLIAEAHRDEVQYPRFTSTTDTSRSPRR